MALTLQVIREPTSNGVEGIRIEDHAGRPVGRLDPHHPKLIQIVKALDNLVIEDAREG